MHKNTVVFVVALAVVFLLAACGGLSSKQKTAANDALKSLRKVSAARSVGANYQQFGQLVIEAKAQVDESVGMLPNGELKNELNAAMQEYKMAKDMWRISIALDETDANAPDDGAIIHFKKAQQHVDLASKMLEE